MNKLVAASIGNAVKIKLIDDKTVRIAAEVKEAERHARRNGIVRNILERNRLSKKAYGALCRLDLAATKLTQTAPTTAAASARIGHCGMRDSMTPSSARMCCRVPMT